MSAFARACCLGALFVAGGCGFNPFCLDCTRGSADGGGGDGGLTPDGGGKFDFAGADFSTVSDGGPCVQTNGGVESCDGIDNDCNGAVDDVAASVVAADPHNCGACGTSCNFLTTHQFGACVGGEAGTPHCEPTGCVPGFVDLDPNAAGCEYACFATGDEICDGVDNDCNGTIDDGFGHPAYASDVANCGACGQVCARPGANVACVANGEGKATCVVTSCVNEPGVRTFNHNGDAASRDLMGCEYKCPAPSTSAGDCFDRASGGCTFDLEVCDGIDNDCNFVDDDSPTDVDKDCSTHCPGDVCQGLCTTGKTVCAGGVVQCQGGISPVDDVCDGLDNNCDGVVDELYRNPAAIAAAPTGTTGYNIDGKNCGGCFDAGHPERDCSAVLPNATAGCQPASDATSQGVCYAVSCAPGYYTVSPATTCASGPAPTLTGAAACNYHCAVTPARPESCNGLDDDCNGCIDDGVFLPDTYCKKDGACGDGAGKSKVTPSCENGKLTCNYKAESDKKGLGLDVDPDDPYALAATETKCDNVDNNCNGVVDTDGFPQVTDPPTACSDSGLGECIRRGQYECTTDHTASECKLPALVPTPSPELCDGLDNDCDGDVDEPKGAPGTNPLYVVDDMQAVTRGMTTFYIYTYEATKPDASDSSSGQVKTRSCSKKNAMPWVSVTWTEAKAACEHAGYRLCTSDEWFEACRGPSQRAYPYGASYNGNVCNGKDYAPVCAGPDDFEQAMPTGTPYGCDTPPVTTACKSEENVVDLSGNVKEWTSTKPAPAVDAYTVRGGAYDNIASGLSCDFSFTTLPPATSLGTVGFRCCSTVAP